MTLISDFFDLSKSDFSDIFEGVNYPWEILPKIGEFIESAASRLDSTFTEISENVWVGEGTTIADTATVKGPAIIGRNVEIRHGAFIRGKVVIGDNSVIGNSCELKNSFIFNNVQIPHFNYVGDAVMGYKSHVGAGVILSNVRSIPGNVKVRVDDKKMDTGLRKFSAILGEGVEIGCNSVLNPGTLIGKNSVVYPLSSVRGTVPERHIYKGKGDVSPLTQE